MDGPLFITIKSSKSKNSERLHENANLKEIYAKNCLRGVKYFINLPI